MRGVKARRSQVAWIAALAAATLAAAAMPRAQAKNIIDEWAQVKVPAPPALKSVRIDPTSTALIVMDVSVRTCSSAKRPRCTASLPAIARLVRAARAGGVLVLYSLVGHDTRRDIPTAFAALPSDTVITRAGPDKFVGSNLESILEARRVRTLITVGTSAEGAVLNTASGAVFRGFEVVVPADGISSDTPYGEQSTVWYLAHAPRVSQHTKLTAVDRISF